MTFKGLEDGKTYKVKISAPGHLPTEVEIKGGEKSDHAGHLHDDATELLIL